MPQSIDLARHQMVALTRGSLAALRAALVRDAGLAAASYLQEAGYAGGEQLFASFTSWLESQGLGSPEELDVATFEQRATEYFRDAGWGSLTIGTLRDAVATLDTVDWAEADPGGQPRSSRVLSHHGHVRGLLWADRRPSAGGARGRVSLRRRASVPILDWQCRGHGACL